MPVGRVEYFFVAPLSFSEYLFAHKETTLLGVIKKAELAKIESLTKDQHTRLLSHMRDYFLVGGMPEIVLAKTENDLGSVSLLQRNIIASYRDDIQKYPGTNHIRGIVREVFEGP
jgi:uncharacterized protein